MRADRAMSRRAVPRPWAVGTALVAAGLAAVAVAVAAPARRAPPRRPERHPQTSWAACNRHARTGGPSTFRPLSDAAAAALVTPEPETRPLNGRPYTVDRVAHPAANDDVPTAAQIRRFREARTSSGQPVLRFNPYFRYVDGRDGLHDPTTDELIQWSAHKWGIPEDWLRAEYVHESYWSQFWRGDEHPVPAAWYDRYPLQARVPHSPDVYRSMGITQVQWTPDGSIGPGSEPLRWQSTAFNLDYQAAMVRFYYDNPDGARSAWGDSSYVPCQAWRSIGGWYRPYPWGNPGQLQYVAAVRHDLAARAWASASFADWSPGAPPPGLRFARSRVR